MSVLTGLRIQVTADALLIATADLALDLVAPLALSNVA